MVDEILMLVRQGLSEETILEMPVDVFKLYCAGARRDEAQYRYHEIHNISTSLGLAFGGKENKETLDDLEDEMEQD